MESMEVLDLYCGAGCFSFAFHTMGFKIKMGIDKNKICCDSYKMNFPDAISWNIDILELDKIPKTDIIIAGPPCQKFSQANRNPDHEIGLLYVDKIFELIENSYSPDEQRKLIWIMEQVPEVYPYIKDKAPRIEIFDCSLFGSKNKRKRLFAGSYPDPVSFKNICKNPTETILATDNRYSLNEMKYLQGIPQHFNLSGNEIEKKMQIGNAVPLEMGQSLAMGIRYKLEGKSINGHKSWHKLSASYHRRLGGNRAYLTVKDWRWCEHCEEFIKIR